MVFQKTGPRYPDMFLKERAGLEMLEKATAGDGKRERLINVPEVYSADDEQISMQAISSVGSGPSTMKMLGAGLARMHHAPACSKPSSYGYTEDNYVGDSIQHNAAPRGTSTWGEFYVKYRLMAQIEMIQDAAVKDRFCDILQSKGRLEGLVVFFTNCSAYPSVLHGDLWAGNYLCGKDGKVYLIDPAVYFGHFEADLAMTEMFGGFSKEFYTAYKKEYFSIRVGLADSEDEKPIEGIEEQWYLDYCRTRRTLYNLYHYLNHYNLFGSGYLRPCQEGVRLLAEVADHVNHGRR